MDLYIYKKAEAENLSDQHKVLLWFLTLMFRDVGEDQVLTLDIYDFKYMYATDSSVGINIEDLNESPLGTIFSYANLGPRMAIRVRDEVQAKIYKNRKLGVTKYTIEDEIARMTAVYLHAALNFMDSWYTDDDFNIFSDLEYKGRFTPHSKKTRKIQDRLTYENMVGSNRLKKVRKVKNG